MKKRVSKFIVSVSAVLCLAVGFSVSAFADVVGGAGLLGSALGSLGVDLLASGGATAAMLAPWLSQDFSIIGALTGVADGYVKVGDSSVTIDGVEYKSIFLDPHMAAELHTQAFDFITQKAITDNSSGILASGYGYAGTTNPIPVYLLAGNNVKSQVYYCGYGTSLVGDLTVTAADNQSTSTTNKVNFTIASPYQSTVGPSALQKYNYDYVGTYGAQIFGSANSQVVSLRFGFLTTGGTDVDSATNRRIQSGDVPLIQDSFEYDYVSGVIDATPLPASYGFQAFVPTQTLAQAGIVDNTYYIDGGIGTDTIIELIELLDDLYGQELIEDAEFTDVITPPVPPQPIDTPLGEIPYEDFLDTFGQSVYGKLDSISDGIDTVGQVIAGQGTDIIEAVDTAGQSVVEELEVIGGAIDTAGQSVVDSVEESTGILEEAIEAVEAKVDELVDSIAEVIEEIMTHPLDLFSAWLDRLPEIPAIKDIFDGIKRHVGIWHYVVEWLSCIGTFLAFFIGLFGDVAYCMVVPIYACVAGAICLAFYKRFAR